MFPNADFISRNTKSVRIVWQQETSHCFYGEEKRIKRTSQQPFKRLKRRTGRREIGGFIKQRLVFVNLGRFLVLFFVQL
jgi:hypothetical protein